MEAREAAEKEWVEVVAMARVRAVVVMVAAEMVVVAMEV